MSGFIFTHLISLNGFFCWFEILNYMKINSFRLRHRRSAMRMRDIKWMCVCSTQQCKTQHVFILPSYHINTRILSIQLCCNVIVNRCVAHSIREAHNPRWIEQSKGLCVHECAKCLNERARYFTEPVPDILNSFEFFIDWNLSLQRKNTLEEMRLDVWHYCR